MQCCSCVVSRRPKKHTAFSCACLSPDLLLLQTVRCNQGNNKLIQVCCQRPLFFSSPCVYLCLSASVWDVFLALSPYDGYLYFVVFCKFHLCKHQCAFPFHHVAALFASPKDLRIVVIAFSTLLRQPLKVCLSFPFSCFNRVHSAFKLRASFVLFFFS